MSHKLIRPLVSGALVAGELAYNYWRSRGTVSAPLSSGSKLSHKSMAYTRTGSGRRYRRKFAMKKKFVPRSVPYKKADAGVDYHVRHSDPEQRSLVTGNGSFRDTISLGRVFTTDLIGYYDAYRIKKVTLCLQPKYAFANGAQSLAPLGAMFHVYSACDPTNVQAATNTGSVLSQFSNNKYRSVVDGEKYYFDFYPKPFDQVDNAGAVFASGTFSKVNPWLTMTASGIQIPHYNCLCTINNVESGSSLSYTYTYTIHFECLRSG